MKDIKQYITEGKDSWEYFESVTDPSGAGIKLPGLEKNSIKWLLIDTETEMISGVTEYDLKQWTEDFEGWDEGEKAVKSLKVGESYDADGGINIYLRIKK